MRQEDTPPHALVGRAGLVFAYVCFAVALATFGGALYVLPLTLKAKLFLAAGIALLTSMFGFMAIATHLALRPLQRSARRRKSAGDEGQDRDGSDDAKGSHRPR